MITKQKIKDFIEDIYNIEDISVKHSADKLTLARGYFCYLCYKYCEEITTPACLMTFLNMKSHATALNSLNMVTKGLEVVRGREVNSRMRKELSFLEGAFLEKFTLDEHITEVIPLDELKTKRVLSNKLIIIRNLRAEKYVLQRKLKSLSTNS